MIEFLPKEKLLELLINDPDQYYKTFFQLDYKHQDIYINEKMFEKLIKNSTELDNDK